MMPISGSVTARQAAAMQPVVSSTASRDRPLLGQVDRSHIPVTATEAASTNGGTHHQDGATVPPTRSITIGSAPNPKVITASARQVNRCRPRPASNDVTQ